jgi:hypothetical protein
MDDRPKRPTLTLKFKTPEVAERHEPARRDAQVTGAGAYPVPSSPPRQASATDVSSLTAPPTRDGLAPAVTPPRKPRERTIEPKTFRRALAEAIEAATSAGADPEWTSPSLHERYVTAKASSTTEIRRQANLVSSVALSRTVRGKVDGETMDRARRAAYAAAFSALVESST